MVEEYDENIYGESRARCTSGTPTDRFIAEWRTDRAACRAAPRGRAAPLMRGQLVDVRACRQSFDDWPAMARACDAALDRRRRPPVAGGNPGELQRHAWPKARSRARVAAWPPDESFRPISRAAIRVVDFFSPAKRHADSTCWRRNLRSSARLTGSRTDIGTRPGYPSEQRRQLAQRLDHRNVRRGGDATRTCDQDAAHAEAPRAVRCRASGCRQPSPLRRARRRRAERGFEDAAVRLHVAVLDRRDGDREQALELEVRLERREAAVRVRDQSDLQARGVQAPQHLGHVFVQREMLARRPTRRRSRVRRLERRAAAAHPFDDASRVVHVELRDRRCRRPARGPTPRRPRLDRRLRDRPRCRAARRIRDSRTPWKRGPG